jgi:hypothetical protein
MLSLPAGLNSPLELALDAKIKETGKLPSRLLLHYKHNSE